MKLPVLLTLLISLVHATQHIYASAWSDSASEAIEVSEEELVVDMLNTIAERLRLMPDVATWKFLNGKAIDDWEREAQLLDQLETKGTQLGLEPAYVRNFFQIQFDAAKMYQRKYIEAHSSTLAHQTAPDLSSHTRPKVSELTNKMLVLLSRLNSRVSSSWIEDIVIQNSKLLDQFDTDVVAKSLEPFIEYSAA